MDTEKQELRLGERLWQQSLTWALDNHCQAVIFDFSATTPTTIKYKKNGALSKELRLAAPGDAALLAQLKKLHKHQATWYQAGRWLQLQRLNPRLWRLDLSEHATLPEHLEHLFLADAARLKLQQQLLKPKGLIAIITPEQAIADQLASLIIKLYDSENYQLASLGAGSLSAKHLDQLNFNCQEPGALASGLECLRQLKSDLNYLSLGYLPAAADPLLSRSDVSLNLVWLKHHSIPEAIKQLAKQQGWQAPLFQQLSAACSLAQLPRLCSHCRQPFQPDLALRAELSAALGVEQTGLGFMASTGCEACDYQGLDQALTLLEWQDFSRLPAGNRQAWLTELNNPGQAQLNELALAAALRGLIHLESALSLNN